MRTGRSSSRFIGKRRLITDCEIFADVGSDASSFGESYGIHTLPQARVHFARRRDATRRDGTRLTTECYPGQCPVSKVQFFLESTE